MIHECLEHGAQYACLAANINFNLEGLRIGFWQLTIDGLSWGAIYALVAVGYTLVFGVLRLINFAHSEIFMLGMFGAYFALDIILGFTPSGNAYNKGIALTVLYLGIAMLFAMLVSGSAAVGLEFVAYRPLRRRGFRSFDKVPLVAIGETANPLRHGALPGADLRACHRVSSGLAAGIGAPAYFSCAGRLLD